MQSGRGDRKGAERRSCPGSISWPSSSTRRGAGEAREEHYTADLAPRLSRDDGPIFGVGVGIGVVALGLVRLGYAVLGLDVWSPMLARPRAHLGPVIQALRSLPPADGECRPTSEPLVLHREGMA